MPSDLSSTQNENFVYTSRKLLKNRNWTFHIEHYFTWKLEFVSNILWMIVDDTSANDTPDGNEDITDDNYDDNHDSMLIMMINDDDDDDDDSN